MVTVYSKDEDALLIRLYTEATSGGGKADWAEIASHFAHRNPHALKVHFQTKLRPRLTTCKQQWNRSVSIRAWLMV